MKCATLGAALAAVVLSASALDVNRDTWLAHVERRSPDICATRYFSECFEQNAAQCRSAAKHIARDCVDSLADEIPDEFPAQESAKWSAAVGQCLGERLEMRLTKKTPLSDYCLNPSDKNDRPK